MHVHAIQTKIFKEKENIINFIVKYVPSLSEKDIVVITSKIVALSEGRTFPISFKKRFVCSESKKVIPTPWAFVTLVHDEWCINAGIDESNAKGKIILLPKSPYRSAITIRAKLRRHFSLKHLGVIITDTRSVPLRMGTIGKAIGYAGFIGTKSYKGKNDLYGRKSRFTESNLVDAMASAAVVLMGEGDEQTPIVIIKNAPIIFTNNTKKINKLHITPSRDIYSVVFK